MWDGVQDAVASCRSGSPRRERVIAFSLRSKAWGSRGWPWFLLIVLGAVLGCSEGSAPTPVKAPEPQSKGTPKYSDEQKNYAKESIRIYRKGDLARAEWESRRKIILAWPEHKGVEFMINFFCVSELRQDRPPEFQDRAQKEMRILLKELARGGPEGKWGLHYFAELLLYGDTSFAQVWGDNLAPSAGSAFLPELQRLLAVLEDRVAQAKTMQERHRWMTKLGAVIKAMGACGGEKSVVFLAQICERYGENSLEDSWMLRHYVASGLGRSQCDAALPVLTQMLNDSDRLIRDKAAKEILTYRSRASIGAMIDVLRRYQKVATIRRSAISVLRKIAPKDLGSDPEVWIRWYESREKNR